MGIPLYLEHINVIVSSPLYRIVRVVCHWITWKSYMKNTTSSLKWWGIGPDQVMYTVHVCIPQVTRLSCAQVWLVHIQRRENGEFDTEFHLPLSPQYTTEVVSYNTTSSILLNPGAKTFWWSDLCYPLQVCDAVLHTEAAQWSRSKLPTEDRIIREFSLSESTSLTS